MKNLVKILQGLWFAAIASSTASAQDPALFEKEVLPLLKRECYECHSHASGKAKGGLVLDSRSGMLSGGDLGPALVPGNPDKSLLIQALIYTNRDLQMPPKGKLDEKEISLFIEWVKSGAAAPEETQVAAKQNPNAIKKAADAHWAFQPLRKPEVPIIGRKKLTEIDRFVEGRLGSAGLEPVALADRRILIRRLYFDLLGLPPKPRDVEAFVNDSSEGAMENLVDQLLAKPEFGERWGRFWLDVARYADSNGGGSESNNTHDEAWRYRDYVITSFNEDKPFNHFVIEQIAGDLLDSISEEQRRTQIIATGYLLMGTKAFGTGDWDQFRLDTIDEQIDTIGKSFLGLAIGCARCHDHKFDPIPTRDYYRLAGILSSTYSVDRAKGWRQGRTWTHVELPIDPDLSKILKEQYKQRLDHVKDEKPKAEKELDEAKKRLADLRDKKAEAKQIADAENAVQAAERKVSYADSLPKVLPIVDPVPMAMAVRDEEKIADEFIRVRGVPRSKGEQVPRGMLGVFGGDNYSIPANKSGRLQLAQWLVDPQKGAGGLVARVMANRIWGHMLGRPIVESTDNFGLTCQKPSHPELLDYLASTFVDEGWSVKTIIRQIALSRVYQLASADNEMAKAADPANVLLWRHQVHRLDAEAIRDAILSISDQLDHKRGGSTLQQQGLVSFKSDFVTLDTPSPYLRRTVYLPLLRDAIGLNQYADETMGMLETFDFADPNLVTGSRNSTTVPTQALFLMNSSFMRDQARATARKILENTGFANDAERVKEIIYLAYSRPATTPEIDRAGKYLFHFASAESHDAKDQRLEAWTSFCQAILASNEFLFLN
jgi:hypothetical protein